VTADARCRWCENPVLNAIFGPYCSRDCCIAFATMPPAPDKDTGVVIESPYLGGLPAAVTYARLALLDAYRRLETPHASHLLGPQVLDDKSEDDRNLGMAAGWRPYDLGARCAVYIDLGITRGMQHGIEYAKKCRRAVEYRSFGRQIVHPVYLNMMGDTARYGYEQDPESIRRLFQKFGPAQTCNWP